jgi:hypothetical protein
LSLTLELGKRERFSKVSRTQLRFLDYINKFLYPSVIIAIIFQQKLRALRYTTSMIISTRRILLATDDPTNKEGKLIYPKFKYYIKKLLLNGSL